MPPQAAQQALDKADSAREQAVEAREAAQAALDAAKEEVAALRSQKAEIVKLKLKAGKAVTAEESLLEPARARRHEFIVKARDEEVSPATGRAWMEGDSRTEPLNVAAVAPRGVRAGAAANEGRA